MFSWLEFISYAPDSQQVAGYGWVGFDLFAQTADMHRDRTGVDIFGAAPDTLQQMIAAENLARMAGE
jgi:hypothetical protein